MQRPLASVAFQREPLFLPQMTAGELYEHVLKTRLAGCEVNQARPLLLYYGKQSRYRLVRLFDLQEETSVFAAYRLHPGKMTP